MLALAVVAATACAPEAPDYRSLLPSSTNTPAPVEREQSVAEFMLEKEVVGLPMTPATLTDLTVSMPVPPGWAKVQDPNKPDAFEVIKKTDVECYQPNATVVVFKLMGDFDANEAIKHGYTDAERSDRFHRLNASMDNFRGMPSAMIEGSYNVGEQRLQTYNRMVIATGPPPINQRYLIQFSVTTAVDQAEKYSEDVLNIIKGFNVAPK